MYVVEPGLAVCSLRLHDPRLEVEAEVEVGVD